jgi:hypothetical protein
MFIGPVHLQDVFTMVLQETDEPSGQAGRTRGKRGRRSPKRAVLVARKLVAEAHVASHICTSSARHFERV